MSVNVNQHVLEILPDFVIGLLSDDETSQVAEHLSGCATCQAELSRLNTVADDLPLALVQTEPPARLKDNLMKTIQHSKSRQAGSIPQAETEKKVGFWGRWLPVMGVALLVLLAVTNLVLWQQLTNSNQQAQIPMKVVALANTQYSPSAMGELVIDNNGQYGTLVVDSLAKLDDSLQYQVWLIRGNEHTSGGVFSVNPDGYASLEVMAPQALTSYDSIGVSIEPFGGSLAPTGNRVLGGVILP
jgi:anti-sigma-K factor RskA